MHFKNLSIPPCVRKAYHLVSIDENRRTFYPTLMTLDGRVEEIWFAGVHADVGGGYEHRKLADISLAFMCNRLEQNHDIAFKSDFDGQSLVNGQVHYHSAVAIAAMGGEKYRDLETIASNQLPSVHKSVKQKIKAEEDEPKPYQPVPLRDLVENQHYQVDYRD